MMGEGQRKTGETYLDPAFVAKYAARSTPDERYVRAVREFADQVPGRRLIDVGCGPGHHARLFAGWGFEVVGIDASAAMIDVARAETSSGPVPRFLVARMQQISEVFAADAFDGAWISASLLHVPEAETPSVLAAIHRIVVDGGVVFVSLKEGRQGARVVPVEASYDLPLEREFTFWEDERFREVVEGLGFTVEWMRRAVHGTTGGAPTHWLAYLLRVVKPAQTPG